MQVILDPIWPWSHLWSFLQAAGGPVTVALLVAGLVLFALPVFVEYRPAGWTARQTLRTAGAFVLFLLLYVVWRGWNSALAERLGGVPASGAPQGRLPAAGRGGDRGQRVRRVPTRAAGSLPGPLLHDGVGGGPLGWRACR